MIRRSLFAALWCGVAFAQLPTPQAPPPPAETPAKGRARRGAEEAVKTTEVVDATALDGGGRPAGGLTAADFEILGDGKALKIISAEFRGAEPLRIAFVVDELSLSAQHIASVKTALHGFVDSLMRPGDEAAILSTESASGFDGRFTSDGAGLGNSIDRLRSAIPKDDSPMAFSAGSLGALRAILLGLQYTPGRKLAVFLSERLRDPNRSYDVSWPSRLETAANRSAVVLNAVDVGPAGDSARALRQGLADAAPQTGGSFFDAGNDPAPSLAQIAARQRGYYLLRFELDGLEHLVPQPLRHLVPLAVRATRPDVHLSARNGALGPAIGGDDGSAYLPPESELSAGLTSPLAGRALRVSIEEEPGQQLGVRIHADAAELTFTVAHDGKYHAVLQTAAAAFQENDRAAGEVARELTIALTPEDYQKVLASGFTGILWLPTVRAKGPYQVRASVLDDTGGKLGAAARFMEWDPQAVILISPIRMETDGPSNARVYPPGHSIEYSYDLANLQPNAQNHAAVQVSSQVLREGKVIYDGPSRVLDLALAPHSTTARISGHVGLGASVEPGRFTLKITAVDTFAAKRRAVTQSIDFEIQP